MDYNCSISLSAVRFAAFKNWTAWKQRKWFCSVYIVVNHDMENKLQLPLCLQAICIVNTDVMETCTWVVHNSCTAVSCNDLISHMATAAREEIWIFGNCNCVYWQWNIIVLQNIPQRLVCQFSEYFSGTVNLNDNHDKFMTKKGWH